MPRQYPTQKCPQCKTSFTPRRRNQIYCTNECRTDINNEVAKERYAAFKKEDAKLQVILKDRQKLQDQLASLIIVAQGVEVIDSDTLRYNGRIYKRATQIKHPTLNLGLDVELLPGGALLMPGPALLFRIRSKTSKEYWEYLPR